MVTATDPDRELSALIEQFTKEIPLVDPPAEAGPAPASLCVALTGTTGFLGHALLERFVRDDRIHKIYCLNRSAEAHKAFAEAAPHLLPLCGERVQFCTAYFGERQLGLSEPKYAELARDVDLIAHSAWDVDHDASVEPFKYPHLRGVRNLVELSAVSRRRPRILFVSSVLSVARWHKLHGPAPAAESLAPDPQVAAPSGYARSKQAAEQILGVAAARAHVPVTILRVGAVAGGPHDGVCRWFAPLVRASAALRALPRDLPDVAWVPTDALADVVDDLVHAAAAPVEVYNVVNPRPAAWADLLPAVQARLGPGVRLVTAADWVETFRDAREGGGAALEEAAAPALEALTGGDAVYGTERLVAASPTARDMQGISPQLLTRWMDEWQL